MYLAGYHHNDVLEPHALEQMMYGYILRLPLDQKLLNGLRKKRSISGLFKLRKCKMNVTYEIMKMLVSTLLI